MMVTDKQYQEHPVFKELEHYAAFYESLSHSVFGFTSVGTRAICNIDSYLFSSVQGTLESITSVLRNGRINDAYSLLRKYYDSAIINIYTGLYLEDNFSIQNFVVQRIDDWMQGKARLPEFREMSQYIRNSSTVAPIGAVVFGDRRYNHLRDRCNDYTHYNFYRNVLLNDNQIVLNTREEALDQFSEDLRDVFILHLGFMFFARGHYMMASDYVDCLDCGLPPEPDSQYWVAPFVQASFDEVLKKHRPDIAAIIQNNTSMHLK